jgi:hypothetical protein
MTPYLPALDRRRHHRRRPTRRSRHQHRRRSRAPASAPKSANKQSANEKCRRRPAAAAPPSRPVQVGRRQSALESAPPRARARGAARRGNAALFSSVHSHVDVAPASTRGACDLMNAAIVSGSDVTTPSRTIFPVRSRRTATLPTTYTERNGLQGAPRRRNSFGAHERASASLICRTTCPKRAVAIRFR